MPRSFHLVRVGGCLSAICPQTSPGHAGQFSTWTSFLRASSHDLWVVVSKMFIARQRAVRDTADNCPLLGPVVSVRKREAKIVRGANDAADSSAGWDREPALNLAAGFVQGRGAGAIPSR